MRYFTSFYCMKSGDLACGLHSWYLSVWTSQGLLVAVPTMVDRSVFGLITPPHLRLASKRRKENLRFPAAHRKKYTLIGQALSAVSPQVLTALSPALLFSSSLHSPIVQEPSLLGPEGAQCKVPPLPMLR